MGVGLCFASPASAAAPTITVATSDKANGSYTTGEIIDIDLTFSEAVTSTGNVTVTLETGDTDRTCTFTMASLVTTASCNYTVVAGDASADLTVKTVAGSIANAAQEEMASFTVASNLAANKALIIDTAVPVYTAVVDTPALTSVVITWTSDEATSSQILYGATTSVGSSTTEADTGTRVTSHSVTVTGLECDNFYSYQVKGSDLATNSTTGSTRTFRTLGCVVSRTVTVADNVAPAILDITSSNQDGIYVAGEVVDLTIKFSEAVRTTGDVTVTLETGEIDRTCTFSLTNGVVATCSYKVQAGDSSADLTVASVSGVVKDLAGNLMTNMTPVVNLAANKALVINTSKEVSKVQVVIGGSATGVRGNGKIELTVPNGVTPLASEVTFIIKPAGDVTKFVSPDPKLTVVAGASYEMQAVRGAAIPVDVFDRAVKMVISYDDATIAGFTESSLVAYKHDGKIWSPLSECVVSAVVNKVTCSTMGVGTVALFGTLNGSPVAPPVVVEKPTVVVRKALPPSLRAGMLVKREGLAYPAVYYIGADGMRYAFPNKQAFLTWYTEADLKAESKGGKVVSLSADEISGLQLGGNVTYRPGTKLIKFVDSPKVYAVEKGGSIRWIATAELATQLYGAAWAKNVEDVADGFFVNYRVGADITSASDHNRSSEQSGSSDIGIEKSL